MQNALPDILCVVQVALEGAISKEAALQSLAKGNLPSVSLWVALCAVNFPHVAIHTASSRSHREHVELNTSL